MAKNLFAVVIVVLAYTAITGCRGGNPTSTARAEQETSVPVVVTTGAGLIRKAADRAFVSVSVESHARNPKDARGKNAEIMTAVRKKLKEARLPDDVIRTLHYYVEPEYDYVKGKQILRGYMARNTIEVRVDEIDRVGEVIDLSIAAGATSVGSPRFDLKDRNAVEREVLKQAAADARAKAEAAAAGAGGAIERVLGVEEHGVPPRPPRRRVAGLLGGVAAAPEAPETQIAPGEIEVRAQVTLTAGLK